MGGRINFEGFIRRNGGIRLIKKRRLDFNDINASIEDIADIEEALPPLILGCTLIYTL